MLQLSNEEELDVDKSILKYIKDESMEDDISNLMVLNFIMFTNSGEIIKASDGFLSLLGFSNEEIEGQNVSSVFFNPKDTMRFSNNYDEDEFSSGEIELKHKNGNKVYTIFYNNYNSEMHMNLMFFIAA